MKKIYFILGLCLLLATLSGCVSTKPKSTGGPLGFFKSTDSGATWKVKNDLLSIEVKKAVIDNVSVNKLVIDPSDPKVFYLASQTGLYYSYDGADSWQKAAFFKDVPITDIAVNYINKCVIFATTGQYVYKTEDCGRTWKESLFDNRAGLVIVNVVADHYVKNTNIIYVANNKGEVLKSLDLGQTWQTKKRLETPISWLIIDSKDSRNIYVATESKGIFKSADGGETWTDDAKDTDINNGLKTFNGAKKIKTITQDILLPETIYIATDYGILKTGDGGKTWQDLQLITPEKKASIFSLAIDPKNSNMIFYGTESTIYKSTDGGKSWATIKSPTRGQISQIVFDPQDSKSIYLTGR